MFLCSALQAMLRAEKERVEAEERAKRDKEAAAAAHAEAERIKQLQVCFCPSAQIGPFCRGLLRRISLRPIPVPRRLPLLR